MRKKVSKYYCTHAACMPIKYGICMLHTFCTYVVFKHRCVQFALILHLYAIDAYFAHVYKYLAVFCYLHIYIIGLE